MNSYFVPLFNLKTEDNVKLPFMRLGKDYSLIFFKENNYTMAFMMVNVNGLINLHLIFSLAFNTYSMLKSLYKSDVSLVSFFGWKKGCKLSSKNDNKIDLFFDTIMLKPIEFVFFKNIIRQHCLIKFEKDFEQISKKDISNAQWKQFVRVRSLVKKNVIPSDVDKLNLFKILDVSIIDYFNKLNQHLFGQMFTMYQFKKAYLKDSLLGVFIDTVDNDLSDNSLMKVIVTDYKKYDVMNDKIAEAMTKWKDSESGDNNEW